LSCFKELLTDQIYKKGHELSDYLLKKSLTTLYYKFQFIALYIIIKMHNSIMLLQVQCGYWNDPVYFRFVSLFYPLKWRQNRF